MAEKGHKKLEELEVNCMSHDFSNYKELESKAVIFPVFYSISDEVRMLMFENLKDLNGYLEIVDIRTIQRHKCWDIKGYRCNTIIVSTFTDCEYYYKKYKFHRHDGFKFLLPVRITDESYKEELAEELYKYAVRASKEVAKSVCRGIYKYSGYKENEVEMEQSILDEIFETNFLYSELNDETIKTFYDKFCNCL